MTTAKRLADRMTEAAEIDLLLNYSLMLDALDRGDAAGDISPAARTAFLAHLSDALDAYEAAPLEYWKHDRVVRVTGMGPQEAAEELESRTAPQYAGLCRIITWDDTLKVTRPCHRPMPCDLHPVED